MSEHTEGPLRAENPRTGEEGFPYPPGYVEGWGQAPTPEAPAVDPVDEPTEAPHVMSSAAEYARRAEWTLYPAQGNPAGAVAEAQVWATLAVAAATLETSPRRPTGGGR